MLNNYLLFSKPVKHVIVILLLCIMPAFGWAQKKKQTPTTAVEFIADTTEKVDIIDIIQSRFQFSPKTIKRSPGKKVYFSLIPISSAVPGGGKALITSTSAGFYLGSRRNTYLSSVSFSPYLNFKGRYSLVFRSNVYTSRNIWNIQGDTRFSLYPEYTYGTKYNNRQDEKLLVNYKYIRFYQTFLRRINPYFLAGIGYNLDYHININTINDTIGLAKFTGYNYGTAAGQNSLSSGLTFNFLYDTRINPVNPMPGAYANLIYRINPYILGNGSNNWKSLYLDGRKYISYPGKKRKMLALWSYVWTALNNNVPYLDLPGIGWDSYQKSGRGIMQNRYRGKTMWYAEGEYRRDLTINGLVGYVVFANFNTITGPGNGRFSGPHPAVGGGLRLKFNKRSNTNIAIDYGISKGNSGIYFNLGEAF
jgi:outer membrane protein assembly factor BamA